MTPSGRPLWHPLSTNLAIVLFNAVLIGLLWWSVLDRVQVERDDTVRAAVTRNNNLAIAFEQYTTRVIESAEATLRNLVREEARSGKRFDLRQFAADHRVGNESLVGMTLADENGDARFVAYSATTLSRTNMADRAHFQALRERDPDKVLIGQPVVGRLTGRNVIPITRRISKPDGSFGGMAMVSIEPAVFSDFLRDANLSPLDIISVTGLDGVTRARLRGSIASSGEDIKGGAFFSEAMKGHRSGTFVGRGTLDGVNRYYSYRVQPKYGLVIAIGTPEAVVMAATNERRTRYLWAAAATSVVLAAFAMTMMIALANRKRATAAATLLAAIVESSEDAIIGMEFTGIVTSWNAGAQRLFGFAAAEMIGQPLRRIIPPERQDEEAKCLVQIAGGETVRQFETVRLCKDGSPIDVSVTVSAVRGAAGKTVAVSMLARDITERKRADAALRHSESEFRTLADAMPQMVWATQPDGYHDYYNQQWYAFTGAPAGSTDGDAWNGMFHPDDQPHAWAVWRRSLATGETYQIEYRLRNRFGDYRWVLGRALPVRNEAGAIVRWMGTCTDIHDLKFAELEVARANRELRQQQEELRVLFDLVPAAVLFKDTENRILRINRHGAQEVGLPIAQIEGRSTDEIFPDVAPEANLADREVIRTGAPQLGKVLAIRDAEGTETWVQRDRVPFRDAEGKVMGIVVMTQDITERKRDQDALRELNAQLEVRVAQRTAEMTLARSQAEDASRAKSDFLAAMSHEIRTPMSGMLGLLELLELTRLDEAQRSTLGAARESGISLLSIIHDILDFSKIEANRLELNPEPASIRSIVGDLGILHNRVASTKNLALHVSVDPAISPLLAIDPLRLGQILNNLIGNAIKFSERGSVAVAVELCARRQQIEELRFVVRDTGIGMSAEQLGHIFQPFVQADAATSKRFGGTGLGLVIARRLTELMGGTLEITSEVDRGTTATIMLAFEACHASAPAQPMVRTRREVLDTLVADRRRAPSVEEAAMEGTLLLIVDDHPTNRRVLLQQAASLGYAAQSANDGVEALALWRNGRFGAVITDCNMPHMNGYELAAEIRAAEQRNGQLRVPIIACTANALQSARNSCMSAGMDDCMVKPTDLATISEVLGRWLPVTRGVRAGQPAVPLRAPATEMDMLDTALLADISGGNTALMSQMLADFRDATERDSSALREAVARDDFTSVMEVSHRMKGATLMLGARRLAQACRRVEAAGAARLSAELALAMGIFEQELLGLGDHIQRMG